MALETAKKETRQNLGAPITVFTDSREALATLQQIPLRSSSPFLRDLICQTTLDWKDAVHLVTIRWIPSHVGLAGHDKADQRAKYRAYKGGKLAERWSLLAHIWK